MVQNIPGKSDFQQAYDENKPPWEIGKPQPVYVKNADLIAGSILEMGCGTGELTLYFAERGHEVTGIDYLEYPIAEAKRKAQQRGLAARFFVMDALALEDLPAVYDSVIDCGLFHVISDEDRPRYEKGIAGVVKPGGRLFLLCFSDREPPGHGPRRIARQEIYDLFAEGWEVESIEPARFEIRPGPEELQFSDGDPFAWFCVIRRCDSTE